MPIRHYKKNHAGRRGMSNVTFEELTTSTPEKSLLRWKRQINGRNNRGIITCRHKGGGVKRMYRMVDLHQLRSHNIPGVVASIEYDPFRTSYIMLIKYSNGGKAYLLAPEGVTIGSSVVTAEKTRIRAGNRLKLEHIPLGFDIHNLELIPGKGGQAIRSAGASAQIIGFDGDYAQVQMPSKELRMIPKICYASIGRLSNVDHNLISLGKAGRARWKGLRPEVRGKVMNPNDHPHGGGEGKNPIGLPYPKTPWGAHALGVQTRNKKKSTNRLIIRTRKGRMKIEA